MPVLAILAALLLSTPVVAETLLVVHAGTVLAVPGEAPLQQQTIIIRDGVIDSVQAGFVEPSTLGSDVAVVDLSDRFVLPGLIDTHVHIAVELGPDYKLSRVTQSDADKALSGAAYARRTLLAGFTTVRDLSSDGAAVFALRDAIAAGKVPGPRMLVAGNAIWATGHQAGFRPEVLALFDTTADCDGPYDCRRAVRAQIGRGADVIKIHATGAVLSEAKSGVGRQLKDDEFQEIVETAHMLGRRVAAHAHAAEGINAALRAGVDSIEHGTFLDAQSIRLFKKSGAYLVPTLMAGLALAKMSDSTSGLSKAERDKAGLVGRQMRESTANAYKAGVRIAFGTDSGVSPHGANGDEFALLVAAGMTPMDAIRAATVDAAALLDVGAEVGSIEPGKAADIVATSRDPLADVEALTAIDFVMRAGTIYKE